MYEIFFGRIFFLSRVLRYPGTRQGCLFNTERWFSYERFRFSFRESAELAGSLTRVFEIGERAKTRGKPRAI